MPVVMGHIWRPWLLSCRWLLSRTRLFSSPPIDGASSASVGNVNMVSAVQGVLLKWCDARVAYGSAWHGRQVGSKPPQHAPLHRSDAPLKEYIRTIDEAQSPAEKFIIADVGAGGLLVTPSSVSFVAGKVKELRDQYQFERALAP